MKPSENKKNRKDDIFEAAVRCFNEKGYYETSIDAIAAEANISKGGIYYHFKSKKALFLELYHYRVNKYFEQIKVFIKELDDPEDRLRMFINKSVHILKENEDFFKFCIEFLSLGVREPEIRDVLTVFYKDSVTTWKQIIEEGIASDKFMDQEPEKTARVLYLLFMGLLFTNFSVNVDFDIFEQNTFQLNKIINSLKLKHDESI